LVERNLAKVEVESSRLFSRSSIEEGSMMLPSFFEIIMLSCRLLKACTRPGAVAKRLCTGLQIRSARFDSAPRLQHSRKPTVNADDLSVEYDRLRVELKRLLEAPVRDMAAVQHVVDRLDEVHMRFKAAHGLHGNNPNE
jgi:hypothetical protein